MLYLSPSCGAAGIFLAGTGLGVSISSPTTQNTVYFKLWWLVVHVHVPTTSSLELTNGANLCVAGGMCFWFPLLLFIIAIFFLHIWDFALIFLGFLF